ncbi:hypothetical protein MA16_Dca013625 [Dendrobium catenatum]|uniref:Uncharacterized protein n=1 Tax=Dendrobium catenatum TaxID=906689 RepID=A0A2I0VUW8_9ASPA|nr:hypothetical protein MA16_Dca013625 [Dendrobium catenatum]
MSTVKRKRWQLGNIKRQVRRLADQGNATKSLASYAEEGGRLGWLYGGEGKRFAGCLMGGKAQWLLGKGWNIQLAVWKGWSAWWAI